MSEESKLDGLLELAERNPEPRCPCLLLLDRSGSMEGEKIKQLNAGLRMFLAELGKDPLALLRVELACVTFGGDVRVLQPFGPVAGFEPPTLTAGGNTPLGAAVLTGDKLLTGRKAEYKAGGVDHLRSLIFMVTDGKPTEDSVITDAAADRIHRGEELQEFAFFPVGVEGADMGRLAAISVRKPKKLRGLAFSEMFIWLSKSLSQVSRSRVGDKVQPPCTDGWSEV